MRSTIIFLFRKIRFLFKALYATNYNLISFTFISKYRENITSKFYKFFVQITINLYHLIHWQKLLHNDSNTTINVQLLNPWYIEKISSKVIVSMQEATISDLRTYIADRESKSSPDKVEWIAVSDEFLNHGIDCSSFVNCYKTWYKIGYI